MVEFLIKQKRKISFLLAFAIFINCIPVYALDSNSAADLPRRASSSAGDSSSRASDEENTENSEPASSKENADDNSSSSDEKITDDNENNNTENSNGSADEINKGENNTIDEDSAADDTAINAENTANQPTGEAPTLTLEQAGFGENPDTISIGSAEQMILLSNVKPEEYQNKTISITSGFTIETTRTYTDKDNGTTYKFLSLGNESFPFSGSMSNADSTAGAATMTLPGSLFNHISDKAKVNNIILVADKAPTADSVPLLARNVIHSDDGSAGDWNIKIQTNKAKDNTGSTASAGVIGVLGADANVAITIDELTVGDNIQPISFGNGYRGAICNEMQANSSLTFNYTENSLYEVKSNNSDAGGIVGHMANGASLTINGIGEISQTVTATNGNAGGIVGKMEKDEQINDAQININDNITLSQTITATGGNVTENGNTIIKGNAGGIVGSATDIIFTVAADKKINITSTICATGSAEVFAGGFAGYYTADTKEFSVDLSKLNIDVSLSGKEKITVVGGVFGILDIKENRTVTVVGADPGKNSDGTTAASTTTVTSKLSGNVAHYGGIVGRAIGVDRVGDKMASSFIVKDIKTVTSSNSRTITYNYGGVAGETAKSGGKSLYFNVNNVIADMDNGVTSITAKNIGGVVGCSNENSMIDICNIKVIGNFKNANITRNAGLVAYMGGGAVRLSGTTDLSGVTIKEGITEKGQLVGTHSSLVFAEKGWTFIRRTTPQKISDLGDWGEIVRLDGFEADKYPFTYNESNHTVTTNTVVDNKVANISTKTDFAALAIAMSCTFGGALINGNGSQDLYSSEIKTNINNDINMSGTGIYSLARDTITTTTKAFKGTINGNNYKITLKSGEPYGCRTDKNTTAEGDGSGQIYDHTFIGLLTLTQGAKINDLTIDGNFNAEATKQTVTVGGISAKTSGLTLNNVTVKSNIAVKRNGGDAVVGGFVGCADGAQITAKGCTLGGGDEKSTLSITGNTYKDAQIGGFVANAQNPTTLNITNMAVNGVEIQSDTKGTAGGFLGYSWDNATVTLGDSTNPGVTVINSSLNYTNNATFGGMVNTGAGYWQVNNNGIVYNSGVSFTGGAGGTNDTAPTGFIVSNGVPTTKRALYLEILPGGYIINNGAITLSGGLSSKTPNVDEICGKSIKDNASNNNAVISIATDESHTGIDLSENACNTYQNKILEKSVVNKNTRYYYNLDAIRTEDTPRAKLMCTALVNYRAENIRNNFSGNILSPIKGEINLTGYSYYPVSMSVPISNATITFDNKGICEKEDTNGNKNKCPTDTNINQHYLMHCGLFYNVTGGLNVNQLTLNGTVGRTSDGNSGALVYGTISGSQSATSTVILNGITLDGITVYNRHEHSDLNNYAPLLINKISDYVTLDVTGVTQTNKYVNNNSTVIAGSSLIGDVGSTSGTNIRLSFSNIQLDARKDTGSADSRYGNTTKTIFTRATLLNSFKYSDATSCYGRYNFINDNCTYGYEIGNGDTGVGGRNPNNQMWYYGQNGADRGFIKDGSTIIYDGKSNKNYTNYIRYVYTAENATNSRYELDINQMSVSILEGCGTYSDPYIITDGNQLRAIAKYLNGTAQNGLGLTFDSHVLEKSYDDGSTAHTKGTGSDRHIMYIYEGKNWYEAEYDSTKKEYKKKSEIKGDDSKILAYLRNAYYLIQPINDDYSITMPYDFTGLGGLTYTGNNITVFSGAVIGAVKDGKYPTIKITTKNGTGTDTSTINQFGGIVRTSAGAVVKDLIVDYSSANITITPSSHNFDKGSPNSLVQDQGVFGGVVGYCTAGDTIIDNVTVTGITDNTLKVNSWGKHLPIGGYVGLVGGSVGNTGGGVILKNISQTQPLTSVSFNEGTINETKYRNILATSDDSGYYYCNPYVGIVLDGYAASENYTLDNTDKNYKIPQLESNDKLNYADGTITLNSVQQLWLLGAIVNSSAASYNGTTYNTGDGAYYRGRTRTANYSKVGTLENNTNPNRADDAHWGGVTDNDQSTKYSYLVRHYASESARTICNNAVTITLGADIDMSTYGGTFRSLGTNYTWLGENSSARLITLQSLNGYSHTITLAGDIKSYSDESWNPHQMGLFSAVNIPNGNEITVNDLTLKGTVSLDAEQATTAMLVGGFAGTIVGTANKTLTFNNVKLGVDTTDNSFTVNHIGKLADCTDYYNNDKNRTATGGFIGGLWNIATNMVFNDCSYTNISVTGPGIVGGLVGRVWQRSSDITINRNTKLTDDSYDFNNSEIITKINGGDKIRRDHAWEGVSPSNDIYGIGGLVGYTASTISISNVRMNNVFIDASGSTNLGLDAGGFVGYVNNFPDKQVTVKDCDVANVGIKGALRSGGVLGTINLLISRTNYGRTTTIDNVTVDGLYTLDNGGSDSFHSATGGFVGFVLGRLTVIDSTVKNSKIISKRYAGGLAGKLGNPEHEFKIKNVTIDKSIIASVSDKKGAGGIVGTSNQGSVPVYGYEILIKNTAVGYWLNNNGLPTTNTTIDAVKELKLPTDKDNNIENTIGLWNGSKYEKYSDVNYQNNKADYGSDGNIGVWFGGENTSNTIKLIAVQTKNCYLPLRMYGNKANANLESNDVIIYADYNVTDGAAGLAKKPDGEMKVEGTDTSIIKGEGTESAAEPIGDGTSGTTTADNVYVPVLSQILTELKNGENKRPQYSNMLAIAESFDAKNAVNWNSDNDGSVFSSTYKTVQTNSEYSGSNFPVIVVSLANSKSVDEQIKTALSLLTNSDPRSVSLTGNEVQVPICNTYKYDKASTKFVIKKDEPSITFKNGRFTANSGKYDNGNDQFTLIQVQYASGTGTGDTYSVWLPIILKKTLDYTFTSNIENGTNYRTENYKNTNLLSGHGEKNTALLTFTYRPSSADWVRMLNNGENLTNGYDKSLTFNFSSTKKFPAGTELVLVDKSANMSYYKKLTADDALVKGNAQIKLSDYFGNAEFKLNNISEMLNIKVAEPTDGAVGNIIKLKDVKDETIKASLENSKFTATLNGKTAEFAYYDGTIVGVTKYIVTSATPKQKGEGEKLSEQYYLTIKTPETTEGFVNVAIDGNVLNGAMATNRMSTGNNTVNGLIGRLFDQSVNVATTDGSSSQNTGVELSDSKNKFTATFTDTISFIKNVGTDSNNKSVNGHGVFEKYAGSSNLYVGFVARLNKLVKGTDGKETSSTVTFPAGTTANVTFKIYSKNADGTKGSEIADVKYKELQDSGKLTVSNLDISTSPVIAYPDSIRQIMVDHSEGIVVEAVAEISFTTNGLAELPVRVTGDGTSGVMVEAKSAVSYSGVGSLASSELATSYKADEKSIRYYTAKTVNAKLSYYVNREENSNINRLGVNGITDGGQWKLSTLGAYDISDLSSDLISKASKIKVTLSLSKKGNNGSYGDLDNGKTIGDYLKNSTITKPTFSADSAENRTDKFESTFDWNSASYKPGQVIQIPIDYSILTGSEFEKQGLTYANYKVTLTVSLLDKDSKELEGSKATDHIIYTNAKVLTDVIPNNS